MFELLNSIYRFFIILATIGFRIIALISIYYCCSRLFHQRRLRISEWVLFFISNFFVLFSVITHAFFPEFHRSFFDILALLFIVICFNLSRYADKVNGRRWWNW